MDKRITEIIVHSFKEGVMNQCILPKARLKKSKKGVDQCIFIKNKIIREHAISWRLNSFMFNRICPLCRQVFNRGHIIKCDLIHKYPFNFYIHKKDIEMFKKEKEMNKDILPENYNILDSLLNNKKYYSFGKITEKLYQMSEEIKSD